MKNFFILTLSVFFMSTFTQVASASILLASDISQSDFNNAFASDRIWYAVLQPGGSGTTGQGSKFKLGGSGSPYYDGNTSINDKAPNPFVINVDTSNFLSVTFNGVATPGGFQYEITESFNTI